MPGGSSSGSAVAVATGEATVAYGTDTGGSIRIPAACCGISGLKTTWGRIPLAGLRPLAPSLDTVGPMAANVAGLVLGMQLLEPGFAVAPASGPPRVGRVRVPAAPEIDDAVIQPERQARRERAEALEREQHARHVGLSREGSWRIVNSWPSPPNSTSWCATRPGSRTECTGTPPSASAVALAVPEGASFLPSPCSSTISARGR